MMMSSDDDDDDDDDDVEVSDLNFWVSDDHFASVLAPNRFKVIVLLLFEEWRQKEPQERKEKNTHAHTHTHTHTHTEPISNR